MNKDSIETIKARMEQYKWYHSIEVAEGVFTESLNPEYKYMWDSNLKNMDQVDFKGKRVLDVGCRDGLFSFEAEKRGAKEVIGIDNDLSVGASEFLIPYRKSGVKMYQVNLYDLVPDKFGMFDIIMFYGVLYHLRFPVWGLKKLSDCLAPGGIMLIESGMLTTKSLENKELLYCPVDDSPYEPTSCTFFNKKGLCVTMRSLGFELLFSKRSKISNNIRQKATWFLHRIVSKYKRQGLSVDREFFIFKKNKTNDMMLGKKHKFRQSEVEKYWYGHHIDHTVNNE